MFGDGPGDEKIILMADVPHRPCGSTTTAGKLLWAMPPVGRNTLAGNSFFGKNSVASALTVGIACRCWPAA